MSTAGENMHIVRFMGGLANQLFQLCLYHRLQEEYGKEQVYADLSIFKIYHDHGGYKLDKWFDLNKCKSLPKSYEVVGEDDFFDAGKRSAKNVLYNGYWQDIEFFPKEISFLDKVMDPSSLNAENRELLKRIKSSSSVSVHVRRGDYLDNYLHGNIANARFIRNAMEHIKSLVKDPVFFVFSNDPDWCEENIRIEDAECHFVRGNESAVELDITMMSACKHNIIANSSFSWWAQYLNKNPEKIVIAPEYWFNQKVSGNRLNLDSFVHVKNVP
ncbi:MAG: alpha-1,2-fucosyltransferase, partial [Lachnospiraceae bacterium]|nr:alpha-1,2-fucosyltransferase [Lachnospiraceae bacterium]